MKIPYYKDPIRLAASLEKRRKKCLEKYGVDHHSKRPEIREKTKKTNLERYGTEHISQVKEFKDRAANSFKENHKKGSENHKNLIEKRKQSSIEKYGVEFPMQSEEIRQRQFDTMKEKYGDEHALNVKELNDKRKSTNLERFGVEEAIVSKNVKNKIKETIIERYGVDNSSQQIYSEFAKSVLFNSDKFEKELSGMTLDSSKDHLNVSLRTILNYAEKYKLREIFSKVKETKIESKIATLLDNIIGKDNYKINSKSIIPPQELDFYIPDKNLAIEVNGLYWHSELGGGRTRSYHKNKWKSCLEKNITLLQFNSIDIENNFKLIESRIKRIIGISSIVVGARKVILRELDNYKLEDEFLTKWHIQGSTTNRNYCISAEYNNEIIGISTWKLSNNNEVELVRLATNTNFSFPGLLSKMISFLVKNRNFSGKILSYSNNFYSTGKLYESCGFKNDGTTPPGYFYTDDYNTLESRIKYQKHKLQKLFDIDSHTMSNCSEWDIMKSQGFDRIWDAGHIRWVKNI